MKELAIREQLSGLDTSKADQIEAIFAPMVVMLKDFEGQFDEITASEITAETCQKAKRLRLDIAKMGTVKKLLTLNSLLRKLNTLAMEFLMSFLLMNGVMNDIEVLLTKRQKKKRN